MPLQLKPDEHQAFFDTRQAPAPMLDLLGAAALRMAAVAARMGVFDALAAGPLSADDMAARTGADPRGTLVLLDALHAHGYLDRDEDEPGAAPVRYANSATAAKWMVRNGGPSFADSIEFWDSLLFTLWPTLERSLTEGKPPTDWYAWLEQNPRTLRTFQSMLGGMARGRGPAIAQTAALPATTRRLLDVGGSHAIYSVAFCEALPELRATVLDFPGAVSIGRENARAEGMEDRIQFREADFIREPLVADGDGGYDAVLLCRVVHGLDAEANTDLLRKAHDALAPGGRVIVVEEYDPGQHTAGSVNDAFMRMFSLNMYHLLGARMHTSDEISGWLVAAGFDPATVREELAGADRVIQAARRGEGSAA
jgi:SAM-dependent methyltransferase